MRAKSKRSTDVRRRAERSGRRAEAIAALYLRAQFFAIRGTRVKTPVGEIDLVATRGRQTVFVEVKARAQVRDAGSAMETVNRQRIVRAAQYYLARHPHLAETAIRFDVIFLAPFSWPRHVRGAFQAD